MAITWGSYVNNTTGNGMRLGHELTQSPSSVGTGTSSVTHTLKLYVETKAPVSDSSNSWDIDGNFSGSGSVTINNGTGGGVDLIATRSRTVSTSYNNTVSSSFSATLTGINAIPGTASVSGSITTPKRPHSAPSAPSSMTTKLSGSTLTTTWKNNPTTAGPYDNLRIRRSVNGGSYADVSTPSGTSTSYSQGIPSKNSTVRYAIRAENEAGSSGWVYGPTITVPPDPPWAPNAPGALRNSDTSHTIFWTNDNPTAPTHPYENIEVQRWDNVGNTWGTIATLGVVSSYTNTSTIANRQYRWRVRAKNDGGASGWVYTGYWSTTPAAPGTPKASKTADDINLAWTNNATKGTGVEVWHASDGVFETTRMVLLSGQPTTYTHASPDPTKTHTYKLKAQAGATDDAPNLYSAFSGQSNTVQLLTNPAAPTQLSPASGVLDAAAEDVVLTWQHNEVDGTAQTGYDLQYRLDGGAWITVSDLASGISRRTFPAGTLENGHILDWQVRTYGQYAVAPAYSPWSAAATLTLSATPQAGVVFPDGITPVDTSRITASWSYYDEEATDQAQWKVKLYSAGGTSLLESHASVGADTSVPLTTVLADGGSYRLGVQVQDGTGLWSPETLQDFTVAYALPDVPTMALSWDPTISAVVVSVTNPEGAGAEVDHNEVWRSVDWASYELVATGVPVNGTITDYIPAAGGDNVYKVIAVTVLEAAAESVPVLFEAPALDGWFLINGGEAFSRQVAVRYNAELSRDFSRDKTLNKYAGRKFPVETVGEQRNRVYDLAVAVLGDDDTTLGELEDMADIPGPLVLRTPDGDRLYVSLAGVPSSHASVYETVTLKMTEVDPPNVGSMTFDPVVYQTNWAKDPSFTGTVAPIVETGMTYTIESGNDSVGGSYMRAVDTAGGPFDFAGQDMVIPTGYTYARATVNAQNLVGATYVRARLGYRDDPLTGTVVYGNLTEGVPAATWTTLTVEGIIPATAQYLVVLVYATDGPDSTDTPAGSEWGLDALCVQVGTTEETTPTSGYFDGYTWSGDPTLSPRWTGTPNASTSQLTRGGAA